MSYKYALKGVARTVGFDLPISRKRGFEICRAIRGKTVEQAKSFLNNVIYLKVAVPFKRYNRDTAHKSSSKGPGRYPIKAAKAILKILKTCEANAIQKGYATANLKVYAIVGKGSKFRRPGRHRWESKRTHIEMVLKE